MEIGGPYTLLGLKVAKPEIWGSGAYKPFRRVSDHLSPLGWEYINLTGAMSGGQTAVSGTAASGLCASNLNGTFLSVRYRTNRQLTLIRSYCSLFCVAPLSLKPVLLCCIHGWVFPSRAAAQSAANKFEELTIRYNLETKPGVGFLYSCKVRPLFAVPTDESPLELVIEGWQILVEQFADGDWRPVHSIRH